MRQVFALSGTYSSDAFGVCSALFELGGLVVMHDASGCNSTYTTHDEPRWYDMDSLVYVSALSELETIMGDDEKLLGDLEETASALHPAFIAVVGTPIPYMIGTDFPAIARLAEERTGIPSFAFPTNGMELYTRGVSEALYAIADRFCRADGSMSDELPGTVSADEDMSDELPGIAPAGRDMHDELPGTAPAGEDMSDELSGTAPAGEDMSDELSGTASAGRDMHDELSGTVSAGGSAGGAKESALVAALPRMNILGATPLDLPAKDCIPAIWRWAERFGFAKGASFSLETSLDEIRRAGEASVNLVVSYGGLKTARLLQKRFGTPYVVGLPLGKAFSEHLGRLAQAAAGIPAGAGNSSQKAGRPSDRTDGSRGDAAFAGKDGEAARKESFTDRSSGVLAFAELPRTAGGDPLLIVGESVYAVSLAAAVELEQGVPTRVLCPVDTEETLLRKGDLQVSEEDELLRYFKESRRIAADPLFRPLAPANAAFFDLPHTAFSGRIFESKVPQRIDTPIPEDFRG